MYCKLVAGLRELHFQGCEKITDAGVSCLARATPSLEDIDLTNCKHVTDEGLKSLGTHCPNLKVANFTNCWKITDDGLSSLATGCKELSSITLHGCDELTDEGTAVLAENATGLRVINLFGVKGITELTLHNLHVYCRELKQAKFTSPHMSKEGVDRFGDKMPFARAMTAAEHFEVSIRKSGASGDGNGPMRCVKPASKLQLNWYQYDTQHKEHLRAATVLQKSFKRWQSAKMQLRYLMMKAEGMEKKGNRYSVIIQKRHRGNLGRVRVAEIRKRNTFLKEQAFGSVVTIQRYMRGYFAMCHVLAMYNELRWSRQMRVHLENERVLPIQRVYRGYKGRQRPPLIQQKRARLAKESLRIVRGYLGRRRAREERVYFRCKEIATLFIQKVFRGHRGSIMFLASKKRKNEACVQIQRVYRGWHSKVQTDDWHRRLDAAAMRLQCAYRGHGSYVMTMLKRTMREEQEAEQKAAAARIQNLYRARKARTKSAFMRSDVMRGKHWMAGRIQSKMRKIWKRKAAATVIQGLYHGWKGRAFMRDAKKIRKMENLRKMFADTKEARRTRMLWTGGALVIQQWIRRILAEENRKRDEAFKMYTSATKLQAAYRSRQGKKRWLAEFGGHTDSCLIIQKAWRHYQSYKWYQVLVRNKKKKQRDLELQEKMRMVKEKETKFMEMITNRGEKRAAEKIEKVIMPWVVQIRERKVKEAREVRAAEEEKKQKEYEDLARQKKSLKYRYKNLKRRFQGGSGAPGGPKDGAAKIKHPGSDLEWIEGELEAVHFSILTNQTALYKQGD
jgi:hypothetical protein